MIDKNEIESKASEFEIHTSDIQRDYISGWVLAGIYTKTSLQDSLVLKGGNCLRKAYFEHTRFSRDLDFSTPGALHEDVIGRELSGVCDFVQASTGVIFEKERTVVAEKRGADPDKKMYQARLYFKDFYGNSDNITISIRLDVKQFDRIFLPVQQRNLIHPYSDYSDCCVPLNCLKLEEILAGKLKCLLQRRHSADLYDFVYSVFLNPAIDLNRREIVSTFLKMTIFEPSPGTVRGLLLDLPFQTIKALWYQYLVIPAKGSIDFDRAVESFKNTVDEMFGSLPVGRQHLAYFPSHFRNPIMEAGHGMTLLTIVYDGVKRLVEPYSLTYKTRKDGVSREYLYVHDLTGGRNSGPGIKAFVHPKIQSLENTDTKFEPRHEMELSKAGDIPQSPYFARPSTRSAFDFSLRGLGRRRSSSRSLYQQIYMIHCPYCGKQFRRTKYDTKLNPHKDRYGNRCFGTIGYIV